MPAPMKSPPHHPASAALAKTVSLTHLAQRWGISRRDVRRMLQNRELPFEQIDGQLRVPREAVLTYERSKKA